MEMEWTILDGIVLPTLYCPFPPRINVYADEVQAHTTEWVNRFELLHSERGRRKFAAGKYGYLAARAYPDTGYEECALVSDWNTWLFLLDDECDEEFLGKHPDRLAATFATLWGVLNGTATDQQISTPFMRSLQDLWDRMVYCTTAKWQARFRRTTQEYADACVWESSNRERGIVPSLSDYIAMRPHTSALNTTLDMIDFTEHIDLPDAIREHDAVRRLALMANNVVSWANDIMSLEKELRRGDVHNLPLALQHERGMSLQEAVNEAAVMHDAEVRAFIDLNERLLKELPPVDDDIQRQLVKFVNVLTAWMRGNIDWSYESGRYRPAALLELAQLAPDAPAVVVATQE